MRKLIAITAILTSTFVSHSALAVDGVMPAPVPGPFQSMSQPKLPQAAPQNVPLGTAQNAVIPQPSQQNFWSQAPRQRVPYWMQNPQQPAPNIPANFGNPNFVNQGNFGNQNNGAANAQAGSQVQGGFNFNAQAQAQGRNANQVYGTGFAPGYFPGYSPALQLGPNTPPSDPRFAQQNMQFNQGYQTPQNPNQQGWNVPWNNNGPWWGVPNFGPWGPVNPNNWQGGYPQGYGAPNGWGN